MSYANKEFLDRWLDVKKEISKNPNLIQRIADSINQYYYHAENNLIPLGEGTQHIVYSTGLFVKVGSRKIHIATKLRRIIPASELKNTASVFTEQITGFDDAFRNKLYSFMPYFIGLISWGNNLALLTEDISEANSYSLETIVRPANLEITHVRRRKDNKTQLFFVDPNCYDTTNEKEIFNEYIDKKYVLPENLIHIPGNDKI